MPRTLTLARRGPRRLRPRPGQHPPPARRTLQIADQTTAVTTASAQCISLRSSGNAAGGTETADTCAIITKSTKIQGAPAAAPRTWPTRTVCFTASHLPKPLTPLSAPPAVGQGPPALGKLASSAEPATARGRWVETQEAPLPASPRDYQQVSAFPEFRPDANGSATVTLRRKLPGRPTNSCRGCAPLWAPKGHRDAGCLRERDSVSALAVHIEHRRMAPSR